jgi:hypothetical protein
MVPEKIHKANKCFPFATVVGLNVIVFIAKLYIFVCLMYVQGAKCVSKLSAESFKWDGRQEGDIVSLFRGSRYKFQDN